MQIKAWPSNDLLQVVAVALLGWNGVEGQGQRCETQADCTGKERHSMFCNILSGSTYFGSERHKMLQK